MTKQPANTAQPQPPSGAFTPDGPSSTTTPPMMLSDSCVEDNGCNAAVKKTDVNWCHSYTECLKNGNVHFVSDLTMSYTYTTQKNSSVD